MATHCDFLYLTRKLVESMRFPIQETGRCCRDCFDSQDPLLRIVRNLIYILRACLYTKKTTTKILLRARDAFVELECYWSYVNKLILTQDKSLNSAFQIEELSRFRPYLKTCKNNRLSGKETSFYLQSSFCLKTNFIYLY